MRSRRATVLPARLMVPVLLAASWGAAGAQTCQAAQVFDAHEVSRRIAAAGPDAVKVLFIGNSHVMVNGVPERVARRLAGQLAQAADGSGPRPVVPVMIAKGGALLRHAAGRADVVEALRRFRWDAVVLQEATAAFVTPRGRRSFQEALDWFGETIPRATPVVLYKTWPWLAHYPWFRPGKVAADADVGAGRTDQLWARMQKAYAAALRKHPWTVAPVGDCWVREPASDTLYSPDGNHATSKGAEFAARIIAEAIATQRPARC